jgi:hypothetical protein
MGKKYGGEEVWEKIVRPGRTSSGHVTLSLPVKKAPLGQIVRNFRLSMRRTHFRTWPLPVTWLLVTSGHVTSVTSGCSSSNTTWTVPIYYSCLIICYVNLSSHVHVFTRKLILVQIVISYHCLFPNWIQSYCQLNYEIDIRESDLWSDHSKHHTKLACVNYLSNYELYLKRRHCHNLVLIYGTRMCFAKF